MKKRFKSQKEKFGKFFRKFGRTSLTKLSGEAGSKAGKESVNQLTKKKKQPV